MQVGTKTRKIGGHNSDASVFFTEVVAVDFNLLLTFFHLAHIHSDLVPHIDEHTKLSNTIQSQFSKMALWNQIRRYNDSLCFFPVDNTRSDADSGVQKLRKAIYETISLQLLISEECPISWMKVLDRFEHLIPSPIFVPLPFCTIYFLVQFEH
jgi:hypothetical protein